MERAIEAVLIRARVYIVSGNVFVNNFRIVKPSAFINMDSTIEIRVERLEIRGSLKLQCALAQWPMDILDKICLDVGSSTGGFTYYLLKRGAARVYAVDCGKNQLLFHLRKNKKVYSLEGMPIQTIPKGMFKANPHIVVIDVSFTSLKSVLGSVLRHVSNSFLYVLIKPQFEVAKCNLYKGIVKDMVIRNKVVIDLVQYISRMKIKIIDVKICSLLKESKNIEYWIYAYKE
ncbi:MAG: hypothetical protein HYS16_00345 [Deltaproteobacteria bacterium]|nr:MAG: hypothetical protein HYS16_00345 [Deltaproteobacteria bacterium]